RGAFALLDIIPGVKGLHAFSTATKAGGVALDAIQAGSKLTLKQTAKQGLSHLDAMGKQALRESAERIRNVPKVLKDTANTVKNTAQEGLTTVKKVTANFGENGMNFGRPRPSLVGMDGLETVSVSIAKNADEIAPATSKIIKASTDHLDDLQLKQLEAIDSVKNGDTLLETTKHKGNFGEMVMDNHLEDTREAVRISSDRVLSLDDKILKGIDGVYETASPPPKYIIAEAKFGSSRLGKTKDGLQMSEDWILGGSRLEDAVGRDVAEQIIDEMVLNPENVQNLLVHIDKAGNVTESILDSFGKVVK
ncbi:hypothetical protein, partial [Listeria booriae]